jgi:hypothetical protein
MDAFDSLHAAAASWLRGSALTPSVPAYWRHLTERHYVWRDDLGEKRATNKMRNDGRGERMMPALIDAGNGYAGD